MNRVRPAARPPLCRAQGPVVALVLLALAASGVLALTDAPTCLHFSPYAAHPAPDTPLDVEVRVDNASDFYGVEFVARFNPEVLEVVDANVLRPGVQISAPGAFWGGQTLYEARNEADNEAGTVSYAATMVGAPTGRNGSGTLATIHFRVKGPGLSTLAFDSMGTNAAHHDQTPIALTLLGGHVGVNTYDLYLPIAQ